MKVIEIISALRENSVFPKLENGKLKLVGKTKSIPQELLTAVKEKKETLIDFLVESSKTSSETEMIPKCATSEYYPLSNAQKRIWILSQFDGGNEAYNITNSLYLKGEVNIENLRKAFQFCIDKHESLRTNFETVDDEPTQVIREAIEFDFVQVDFADLDSPEVKVKEEVKRANHHAFNLGKDPLLSVKLIKISEDQYAMIFTMHHIISDGWSIGILVQEVMKRYKDICIGAVLEEDTNDIQYKDFTVWLNQKIEGDFGVKSKEYWSNKSLSEIEPIHLPLDFPRPEINLFEGAVEKFYFDLGFYRSIEKYSGQNQTTIFNVFRSVLSIVLHKWSSQNKIAIGSPLAGRSHYQLNNQIGLYVNTLPLVSNYVGSMKFVDYLKDLSQDSFELFRFQEYPLDLILDEENIERDTSRNPLFDVMMVVQNTALGDGSIDIKNQHKFTLDGLDSYLYGESKTEKRDVPSKFDLSFNFAVEPENKYFVEIEYRTKLFKKNSVQRLFKTFQYVLEQVLSDQDISLGDIAIVNQKEQSVILQEFNSPIRSVKEKSIVDLILPNLKTLGEKVAVQTKNGSIDYATLNLKSSSIASKLNEYDTEMVGLFLSRSEGVLYSVLGAFKAHKTYVPIDVKYPSQRVEYIIEDAGLELILTDSKNKDKIPESYKGEVLCIESIEDKPDYQYLSQDDKDRTAYLIYTSGSTGKPKGVEISHKNAIAFLNWSKKEFNDTPYQLMYAVTSYCFDLSVFEILLPLIQGKSIRFLNSALEIEDYLETDQNVFINTVPSVVRTLLDQEICWENVEALNMAGEPVPKIFKDQLDYQSIEVRNLYGPSEDTTYSTIYRFKDDQLLSVPIGVPVGDSQLYILDENQNVLPIGVEGEICLSGESVAKGYYNKPELTAEKFIQNPFQPDRKMYRTGDIGKWTVDGQVEFVGRMDDQVKIRGHRIELGEIQYQLENLREITQAVVVVDHLNQEPNVVAYYELNSAITSEKIEQQIADQLPSYMVPSVLMELDKIPLNSNGKIDKKKLPDVVFNDVQEIVAPNNETQVQLLNLWEETLNRNDFGIQHNFFELGGHSLKATKLKSLITRHFEKEITLNEIFQHPSIVEMSELIDAKSKRKELSTITVESNDTEHYPLSFAQERLWVLTKFEEASRAYHMPAAFEIKGGFDSELFEKAMNRVVVKHESLRTLFKEIDGTPVQIVLPPEGVNFNLSKVKITGDLNKYLVEDWSKPFLLEEGSLIRVSIIESNEGKYLSFNMHHIISDGWSIGVLINDVMQAYNNLLDNDLSELLPLEVQYKDFAIWQRKELTDEVLNKQLKYWRDSVFANGIQALELPYDNPRPEIKTYAGNTLRKEFSKQLSESLKRQSIEAGVSLYMSLMTNVNILLKKLSNQDQITVGTPVSGRESSQLQKQIGFYVNTLPINSYVDGGTSYSELLKSQRKDILEAFEYQNFPFEMLVESLQPKRDMSRSPLFDVMVTYQNFDVLDNGGSNLSSDLTFRKLEYSSEITKYDLTFSFSENQGILNLELEYNSDLFKNTTIQKFADQLEAVLKTTLKNPDVLIKDVSIIAHEDEQLLLDNDQANVGYNKGENIISLFQSAVKTNPNAAALRVQGKSFSYKELDELSGQLAYKIYTDFNLQPEELVVLHTERTEWMIISILAVLKAGGAYVPIDPEYPASRIEYILEDSKAKLILTDQTLPSELAEKAEHIASLDVSKYEYKGQKFVAELIPEQLAYIIYTSGTTGNPKGVLIEHRNVNRLLFNENDLYDFDANDKWSLFHSYCFDFSVWEMYGALLKGGTLVMVPKDIAQDSSMFYNFIQTEEITVLNQTPTAFRSLCLSNKDRFDVTELNVRYVIFGGEALMPATLKDWSQNYPKCKLVNMYGITETTVHVTYKEIGQREIELNQSNIGLPIPTLSCYVLDVDLQPSPVGVVGELCVGGAGVARGYHNRPELTADKFVVDPRNANQKIYRSGDFAKVLPNGDLEYLGRKDEQVKIRGHRIELSEIEQVIKDVEIIKDAVVTVHKGATGEYELSAYLIIKDDLNFDLQNFRLTLSNLLPGYMVPGYFIQLDDFPLTANGKLDKKGLPKPEDINVNQSNYVAPRNEVEEQIVEIWQEALGQAKIGIKDNFFDLGGHSLKATRVISMIQEKFGVKIDIKTLFIDPTIENLSGYVETLRWMEDSEQELEVEQDELIL